MVLKNEHKSSIEKIKNFIDEGKFYLAGGTAVYYYLKHRESIVLDFFTKKVLILEISEKSLRTLKFFFFQKILYILKLMK